MSRYPNLPGFVINTVDGGLAARRPPQAKSTLVFGSAAQGVAESPYQVTDRALAAQEFGFQGTLIRAMEEAAISSDNIILFRMGSKPAVLKGVGLDTTVGTPTAGFDIDFGQRTATTKSDYKIFYKAGILAVWLQETTC